MSTEAPWPRSGTWAPTPRRRIGRGPAASESMRSIRFRVAWSPSAGSSWRLRSRHGCRGQRTRGEVCGLPRAAGRTSLSIRADPPVHRRQRTHGSTSAQLGSGSARPSARDRLQATTVGLPTGASTRRLRRPRPARRALGSVHPRQPLYRFIVPAVAGPARLVPLAALADDDLNANALRVAAKRGRLQASQGADGQWRSTRNWVDDYRASRYRQAPEAANECGRSPGPDGPGPGPPRSRRCRNHDVWRGGWDNVRTTWPGLASLDWSTTPWSRDLRLSTGREARVRTSSTQYLIAVHRISEVPDLDVAGPCHAGPCSRHLLLQTHWNEWLVPHGGRRSAWSRI